MTWSYGGDPANSPLDAFRFGIGDVNAAMPLINDAEANYLLAMYGGDATLAGIRALEVLIAQAAYLVDETVGSVSVSYSQRRDGLAAALANLQKYANLAAIGGLKAGGIHVSERTLYAASSDLVRPMFRVRDAYGNLGDDDCSRYNDLLSPNPT